MPIEGLTETVRIPRLGKIHLGIKVANKAGVEYPKATDYFVCDVPSFQEVYPGQPKALDICFPTDRPEDWSSQWYRAYSASRGLTCKGDGNTASRLVFAEPGSEAEIAIAAHDPMGKRPTAWREVPCPGRECSYYEHKGCRGVMMLQFLLPKVAGLGIWQLDTSSLNSIININSAVKLILSVHKRIAFLPLVLRIVPQTVSPGGQKKIVYVLQLDIPVRLTDLADHLMLPEADEEEMPELLYPTAEEVEDREEAEVPVKPEPVPEPKEEKPLAPQPIAAAASTGGAPNRVGEYRQRCGQYAGWLTEMGIKPPTLPGPILNPQVELNQLSIVGTGMADMIRGRCRELREKALVLGVPLEDKERNAELSSLGLSEIHAMGVRLWLLIRKAEPQDMEPQLEAREAEGEHVG